jgi:hypothetical protein
VPFVIPKKGDKVNEHQQTVIKAVMISIALVMLMGMLGNTDTVVINTCLIIFLIDTVLMFVLFKELND